MLFTGKSEKSFDADTDDIITLPFDKLDSIRKGLLFDKVITGFEFSPGRSSKYEFIFGDSILNFSAVIFNF
jgi:hypothetical protein